MISAYVRQFVAENAALHEHAAGATAVQRLHAAVPGRRSRRRRRRRVHGPEERLGRRGHSALVTVPVVRRVRRHGRVPTLRGAHVRRVQR